MVRREPRQYGIDRTRWRLADLLATCEGLRLLSPQGLHGLLHRLGISYQRGRSYVHSPDPEYADKLAYIDAILAESRACTDRLVAVYLDELTYYRQPAVAPAWEGSPDHQPRAPRSYRADTATRVVATLDAQDARVVAWQGSKVGIAELVRFFRQVCGAYPQATRIHVILDHGPVHFHPDVWVALAPQVAPWQPHLPANWATTPSRQATKRWGDWQLPIQLVALPTYASWCNPIEKLWRKARQAVLHLHREADRLEHLRERVLEFLRGFAHGSQALLRYVGLLSPH